MGLNADAIFAALMRVRPDEPLPDIDLDPSELDAIWPGEPESVEIGLVIGRWLVTGADVERLIERIAGHGGELAPIEAALRRVLADRPMR